MRPPLRWGILGTGGIAAAMAADIAYVPDDARVVAVASRSSEAAAEFAERFGVPESYGSYQELCASDLDVVYVATPHSDHLPSSLLALSEGKHVLCEKPLTATPAETAQLLAAASVSGRFCMEAVWMRCNPLIRLAAEMVRAGAIGQVRQVRASFGFPFRGEPTHRVLDPRLGGGAILDLGTYPAHLFELLLGKPASVQATGTMALTGVDATSSAIFDYPGDETRAPAQAVGCVSIETSLGPRAEICGTKARLELDNFTQPTSMTLHSEQGTEEFTASLIGIGLAFEVLEVGRCVRAGQQESALIGWDATRNVAGMLASWRAALERDDHRTEVA